MLKLFLSTSFAVLTRKKGIFVALLRRDVQKGTEAYMKETTGIRHTSFFWLKSAGVQYLNRKTSISYINVQARDNFISDPNNPVGPPLACY